MVGEEFIDLIKNKGHYSLEDFKVILPALYNDKNIVVPDRIPISMQVRQEQDKLCTIPRSALNLA